MKSRILIIDDEPSICAALELALVDDYTVKVSTDADKALELLREEEFDLVLLDLKIGQRDGVEVLKVIKSRSTIPVIMMTAYGSIHSSVKAMKSGAFTYLTKPLDIEELFIFIEQALEFHSLNNKVNYLCDELQGRYQYGDMIGKSPAMQGVYKIIEKLKDVDACVTIYGESGTGKELASRAMHFMGRRKNEMFVEVNCAAIPEGLLEEEFFGHKRGSFTGAVSDKKGKFELADKGTLFLDEIGDMPISLQAKLLRVLEQKEFTPIGSNQVKKVDVRVVVATNRDLAAMVREGTFRQDLYYRLNVVEIKLPPLRQRKQDIPLLCRYFIEQFSREQGKKISGMTGEAERIMLKYNYPGNVRELSNAIEYAAIITASDIIGAADLPDYILDTGDVKNIVSDKSLLDGKTLREIECMAIAYCLEKNEGNRKNTAVELGISERGLRNKISQYNLNF